MAERIIKFRAWDEQNKEMRYPKTAEESFGHGGSDSADILKHYSIVMQFTGLADKNSKEIYEGDIIRVLTPYRSTQTHTGDNIPNGSYTEPMEALVRTEEFEVVFKDGMFGVDEVESWFDMTAPLAFLIVNWTIQAVKDAIVVTKWATKNEDWFTSPEDGDLKYLMEDCKCSTEEEFIKFISGAEVIGNIYENPELLK